MPKMNSLNAEPPDKRFSPHPEICPYCGTYLDGALAKKKHEPLRRREKRASQMEEEKAERD